MLGGAAKKLSIADFTCVATWRGFVYVAFVIVGFVRRIVGGRAYTAMRTKLVLDALEQALHDRELDGQLIIRIAARKTSRCGTRTACWRPARRPGSGASATPTIMRSSSR